MIKRKNIFNQAIFFVFTLNGLFDVEIDNDYNTSIYLFNYKYKKNILLIIYLKGYYEFL